MSGSEIFIRADLGLSDTQVELLAGSMNVYMLLSILAAGRAADALGRRGALVLANAFFLAGALGMCLGASYAALMAARFVTGAGVGISLVVAPVYNAEISPASTRGVLSSLLDVRVQTLLSVYIYRDLICVIVVQICINVGILLGYFSNYIFADLPVRSGWRVMYAVGGPHPLLLAAGVDADALAVLERT